MSKIVNTTYWLIKFFSVPSKPVRVSEFLEFWGSLTQQEKLYYRLAKLEMDTSVLSD